ncbi:large conductance mechanosensitive channel protein MscL [Alicyclobacillus ferrooxydans]|uniref:Large-conductance mechanosensitive channel n=1 Tax=Alicyclobacillus ferrooxydans TaxID=471514 RepID=A0A0P9CH94_9BACL|nr:large conductance mechanosensitive channel protein MscL [Alicyclobacillus ferrooxydans]KPV44880.1 mechanosensitive ion channel protein MscL [Alicyclobacillus ferrooxydans]
MLDNFKKFIVSSNVLDWAIGIVVGTAFGKIVYSFINDIVMPPIGLLLGKVDFRDLFINLTHTHYASLPQARQAGAPTINYGIFLSTIVDFLVVAFVVYITVTQMTKWYSEPTKECPYCTSQIPVRAVRCPKCTSRLDV